MIRRHVFVTGRVQGVGYRQACADRARRSQVAGWVRNRSDGRVEAVFEGDPAAVTAMLAWCRLGPTWAEVVEVVSTGEPLEGFTNFRVVGAD